MLSAGLFYCLYRRSLLLSDRFVVPTLLSAKHCSPSFLRTEKKLPAGKKKLMTFAALVCYHYVTGIDKPLGTLSFALLVSFPTE